MRYFTIFSCVYISALTGCSSMLYFPTRESYYDFGKLPAAVEPVRFENSERTALTGVYFSPPNFASTTTATTTNTSATARKPLVIQFHGNGQNLTSHFATLFWLVAQGYDYFTFDYEGYGASDGSPSPRKTVLDGRAAVEWAEKRFPDRPLVLVGQSLGGAIAMRVAEELRQAGDKQIQLMVADSTFVSFEGIARDVLSRSWITWLFQPLAYVVMSDRYAPEDRLASLPPLIVVHGRADPVVPSKFGEQLFAEASPPKELWLHDQPGHVSSFYDPVLRARLLTKLADLARPKM